MPGRIKSVSLTATATKSLIAMSVMFATLSYSAGAAADELQDVKAHGELVCGTLATSEPMGFTDAKTRKVVGFDVDICQGIADQLGVKMVQKSLTVDARIPELQIGRVNIISAALGYTNERAKQIDFSSSHFQNPIVVLAPKAAGYTHLTDLNGKRVGMTSGSTAEYWLRKKFPDVQVATFHDFPSAFLAFQQNKVSGVAGSQTSQQRYLQAGKGKFAIIDEPINWEPQALGIKKNEPAFLAAVNGALQKMEQEGQIQKIWDKWLGADSIYKMQRVHKLESIEQIQATMN